MIIQISFLNARKVGRFTPIKIDILTIRTCRIKTLENKILATAPNKVYS